MKSHLTFGLLLLCTGALGAPAWAATVKVCHVPPGNPANFHTITVSDNALQAHLGHGDLLGSCFEYCDQLCDDGNACTIDACDATEHCAAMNPPVNCDDSNLCTIDSCDPATGCASTPVACPAGQTCDASNGSCESTELTCPCAELWFPVFPDFLAGQLSVTNCFIANDGGLIVNLSGGQTLVADASVFVGLGKCALIPTPVIFVAEERAQLCVQALEQEANRQGFDCR